MALKLLLIGCVVALLTCLVIYVITPGHPPRAQIRNLTVAERTTAWSYGTAEYFVINPAPFGRLRAALHTFLYH